MLAFGAGQKDLLTTFQMNHTSFAFVFHGGYKSDTHTVFERTRSTCSSSRGCFVISALGSTRDWKLPALQLYYGWPGRIIVLDRPMWRC